MRSPHLRLSVLVAAALGAGAMSGCYHHVIRDTGYGDDNVKLYEPNLPDEKGPMEKLESAVWGDSQTQSKAKIVYRSTYSKKGGG